MVLCISFLAAQGALPVVAWLIERLTRCAVPGKDLTSSPVFPHNVHVEEHEANNFCLVFCLNVAIFGTGFLPLPSKPRALARVR
jgi:hypothetical protein